MRLIFAAILIGLLPGCTEKKADLFAACRAEYIDYYLAPRPQGRPPDDVLLKGATVCMMAHGYKRNEADQACTSPLTLVSVCFYPALPLPWLRSFFE